MNPEFRHALSSDMSRLTEIYNQYVAGSHVSFDMEPWTVEQRVEWFSTKQTDGVHQVWVATIAGELAGAAWSGPWRAKKAYDRSVETTVVLDGAWTGRGIGPGLVGTLLDAVTKAGAHRAYAIVALPNVASISMHHRLGYRTVGTLEEVGYKMGRWWTTEILEKNLGA